MGLSEVQGQPRAVAALRRVAERKLRSPLLLVGTQGTGKRFAVQQLAREIFCANDRSLTCECFPCLRLREDSHPDYLFVTTIEDKDIGVDQIREVTEAASSYPSVAPLKLIVIDGAERMTAGAANAFLKTLEEPASVIRFFLLAEHAERVMPTIRSRCGEITFGDLPESFIISRLTQFEKDSAKALVYARMAEGSVGRAIQFWGSGKLGLRDRVLSILDAGVRGDLSAILFTVNSLEKDLPLLLQILDQLLHDLLMLRYDPPRMIHQDISSTLENLKLPEEAHLKLLSGVRVLRRSTARINLTFHVQTLFVDTFFKG